MNKATGLVVMGLFATFSPYATSAQDVGAETTIATTETPPSASDTKAERPHRTISRMIDEVVVTAQKREENLQDVPISVQAFSAEALDARGISDPVALQNITPGLVYSQTASYSIIYIRGIGTDAFIPSADASIATYIDGVYFPFSHGLAQNFGAVERVEVLKGPQGTLFGRNSTGGAINVITKKPGRQFEASLQSSVGNYSDFQNRAYVNLPVTDSVAVSVSALHTHSDFYYTLTDDSPHEPLPPEVSKGGRIRVQWEPIDNFDITLSGLLLEQTGSGNMITQQDNPFPRYELLGATRTADYKTSVDAPVYFQSRTPVIYGEANLRTNWFDTKLIASQQRIRSNSLYDYDASKAPLVSFEAIQVADVDAAELQIISNDSSWRAEQFKWIAGIYFIDSLTGFNPVDLTVARDFVPELLGPLVSGLNLGGLGTAINVPVTGLLDTKSTAAYFQGTWHFTDWLGATVGGRYQTETRRLDSSRFDVALSSNLSIPGLRFAEQEEDTSNFSPKVSIDVRPNDDMLVYASWQKGFKSGTFNIINIYVPSQFIEPEEVTAIELGLKSKLFDRRLQFNAAVFNTDVDNMQVQFISLLTGGAARFETAKGARSRGAEFDVLWEVAPDTLPGLVATATGSYVDAEYTDYKVASGFTEAGIPFGGSGAVIGGGVLAGRDFTGNRIVRAPEFSGNVGLSQTLDVASGSFEIAGDAYYNSGYFFNAQNTANAEQDAFTLYNVRASYLHEAWGLRVTLFGKNITGEKYFLTNLPTDFGTSVAYAQPRTYGVRLNWDF